jgi:hypothetical protein
MYLKKVIGQMPIFHQTGSLGAPLGKGCLMLEVVLIPSENQDDACIQSHSVLPAREVGTDTEKISRQPQ